MNERHNYWVIIITILIAYILTLLPMPDWTVWLRPAWVLMVMVYWILMLPEQIGIGSAWLAGIFLDILEGTLLGEHALAMTIVAYFAVKLCIRLRMYPILQQSFSILIFAFIYNFVLYCVQGFVGKLPTSGLFWLSPIVTMLFWPWVHVLLQDVRRRFHPTVS